MLMGYPSLAGWAGGCWGPDAMLLLPHATDEKGLDPMHVALVWAQEFLLVPAPEATSTSKLSGYPKALTCADPTANADFIYLLIYLFIGEVSTVCQALMLQSWKPSWVVKVLNGLAKTLCTVPVCLRLPTDLKLF